jgi:20S proteasome, alpha and beta subunits
MAADTRMTEDGAPYGNIDKIYRVGNSILGICGDAMMARYFIEWFKSPKRNPRTLHSAIDEREYFSVFSVIELNPGGIQLWDGWGVPLRIRDKFFAIGSGAPAALSYMKLHRKQRNAPIAAVRASMGVDQYSGGEVVYEKLLGR